MTAAAWLRETFRWGQINFNSRDPAELDVDWWAQYWARCRLQGVTLNVGGPMAFYPTDVPLHRRSPYVQQRDLLGATVAAAKGHGLRVLGRLDPSFTTRAVAEAHPDWCTTGPDGSPVTVSQVLGQADERLRAALIAAEPEPVYLGCFNSPYYAEFIPAIITEVLDRYDLDGIWTNGWPAPSLQGVTPITPHGMCHCRHCLAAWQRAFPGRPRPIAADPDDADWRNYVSFLAERVESVQTHLRTVVAKAKPDATFMSAVYAVTGTALPWSRWVESVDALGVDGQGRPTLGSPPTRKSPLWGVGFQSELSRAVARGKPIFRFHATYMADAPLHRHAARPPLETTLQMIQALAHGERPKWHTLGGVSHDRRWMDAVEELDVWMADHDRYLRNTSSLADVAVVWSPRSVQLEAWRDSARPSHNDALLGWYAALTEHRIPFEFLHEDHLDAHESYQVVVLPTGLALSDEKIRQIQNLASRGAAIVSCCDALARDDWGRPRDQGAKVLPWHPTGELVGPMVHSAIRIDSRSGVFGGLGDTDIVVGGRWLATVEVDDADVTTEGWWIPQYPTNPTHDVILPPARDDAPAVAYRRGATPPAIHITGDLDACFGRDGLPDHGSVMTTAVRRVARQPWLVTVEGDGFVDVRAWRQATTVTVYLVNLDSPMLQSGLTHALRPMGPFDVTLQLRGAEPRAVRLLRAGAPLPWRGADDGHVLVTVPRLTDFEVVAFDLL